MDLKKGLSFVAFGFLFTLVNVNLTFDGATVNLLPDFVGWILLYLAFDKLGGYTAGKLYLKWIPLLLAVLSAFDWYLHLAGRSFFWLQLAEGILSVFYLYVLFGVLENVARDHQSPLESRLHTLKYLLLGFYVLLIVLSLMSYGASDAGLLTMLMLAVGLADLITAIVACVTLFQLRNWIPETADSWNEP